MIRRRRFIVAKTQKKKMLKTNAVVPLKYISGPCLAQSIKRNSAFAAETKRSCPQTLPDENNMAKKAERSEKSLSSPRVSSAPAKASASASKGKLVLRVKSNEGMKRPARQTNSAKKPKAKLKKNQKKLEAKKPKKPPTAFFYFLEDFRKQFQEENPDVKSMRDIGKACGEKWKTMTYEEKVQYYDIATEKRAEFDRAMTEFNKRMESGEYEEGEEDSEFTD